MKNFKDEVDRLVWEYIKELEEKNKTLKEERDSWEKTATKFTNCIDTLESSIKNLEEENRKLKEKLEWYQWFDNYLTNHWFDMKKLKEELEIWKLTAKDYAKLQWVESKDLDLI